MKKRVWLMTAVVCMLLGGALFSIGRVMGGKGIVFDFTGKSLVPSDMELKEFSFTDMDFDAFESVRIDVSDCKIYIYSSIDGKYGVDMKLCGYDNDDIQFGVEGDELVIKSPAESGKLSFFYVMFSDDEQYIKLYIPDGACRFIDASTRNDRIVIEDILADGEVSASTTNANIKFLNVSGETLSAVTTNSNVDVDDVMAEELTISTTNGEVKLSNVQADSLDVKTTNSNVALDDVNGVEAVVKTTNGDISLKSIYFDRELDAQTSNSSIKAVLYGDASDYSYEIKTSNSNIKIDGDDCGKNYTGGEGQSKVKLTTSNGKVTVDFK